VNKEIEQEKHFGDGGFSQLSYWSAAAACPFCCENVLQLSFERYAAKRFCLKMSI
jgi:hypothetical protein